jgi:ribonucleoside-diphosphate reductase alpha chain
MTVSGTKPGKGGTVQHSTVLEGVRAKVFMDRYSLKDQAGKPIETTPEEMWRRVARGIAAVEETDEKRQLWEDRFYDVMADFKFVPGGRILAGAGTPHAVTYYNCYVISQPEDSRSGIFDNLKILVEIMARGGGVGVNLSSLRPKGSYIKTVNGHSSGPVSWAELYSVTTGDVIQQGGSRRGALMLMLDDDHPDVETFITAKRIDPRTNSPVAIEHANISVAVSDDFMQAVKDDADWALQFPTRANVAAHPELASQVKVYKTVKARDIWRKICESAWATAEPGLVFMERCQTRSNTWYYENIRCVNPCVTGYTLIYTSDGLRRADELAREGQQLGVVTDGRFGHAATTAVASAVFPTGTKLVYSLRTKEGYRLRATADHRVMTPRGWVELQALQAGDKIHILNRKGGFGSAGSAELGRTLGWLIGDGTIKADKAVLSFFGREKHELAPRFAADVNTIVGPLAATRREYAVGVIDLPERDEARVGSARLRAVAAMHGLVETKHQAPAQVLAGSEEMQRGFLQALFTADGSVQDGGAKGGTVRLASNHVALLEGVQQLLLNFGIASRIYRNRRPIHLQSLPDGQGGYKEYLCAAQHELAIAKQNLSTFATEINFLMDYKREALADYIGRGKRGPYAETFVATVESVEADGVEEVFDLTEPLTHSFVANGIVVHNCGEQPLGEFAVCNLGAMNVSAYAHGEAGAATFDYAALAQDSRVALRFLDNVIDANDYFLEENAKAQLGTRRTGLGTMGLADALIKLGIPYGSPEAVEFIERAYATIRDAAYDMSADIAAEKTPAPDFVADKFLDGYFVKTLPDAVRDKIAAHGIRNVVLLTQAPTGTTSLLAGVSSGIEPVFSFAMKRVDRTGEHMMYHPLLQQWKDAHPDAETPGYFVCSSDLTPEEHIAVQATVQRFTDSSISKTCNAPNDHTVEQVDNLYMLAYEQGCKGITYYRDGSRDAVLTHIKDEKKAEAPAAPAAELLAPVMPPLPKTIRPRPAVLHGYTRNIKAPEGTVNITVNSDDEGPLEVFINVGRSGSDVAALAEALGRLLSITLRIPSPMPQDDRLREISTQLRGIGGSRSIGFGPEQIRSLPDAVGKALGEHLDGHPALQPPPMQLPLAPAGQMPAKASAPSGLNGHGGLNGNGHGNSLGDLGATYKMTGNLCPECGSSTLVYEEGCKKCLSCGHSEC